MTQADSVHSTPPTNTSANHPPGGPESPQDSLYLPTDISPEEVFQAIGRLRKEARDEIDRLIRFLDENDNHMELEPDGTEGEESDEPEDNGTAEDSLGSLERHASAYGPEGRDSICSQTNWAGGRSGDVEDEHDGREPECNDEGAPG
jgi:hypothetical protein